MCLRQWLGTPAAARRSAIAGEEAEVDRVQVLQVAQVDDQARRA
jgi:hypothetical protein